MKKNSHFPSENTDNRHKIYQRAKRRDWSYIKNRGWDDMSDGTKRLYVKVGAKVSIVLKQDQRSGKLTDGIVKDILTNSPTHPHGIKVRLTTGEVGRIKNIINWEKHEQNNNSHRHFRLLF